MKLALKSKDKFRFVDGSYKMPAGEDANLDKWKKVDSMVTTQTISSLPKELVDAFIYVTSSKDLWEKLKERFKESNEPLLYQIKHDINNLTQSNRSISLYFTKMKKLWAELVCLTSLPMCECGASKLLDYIHSKEKLVQFLMGLNESYDHMRNHILIIDPLLSMNKVYSMVLRVEKQRKIHTNVTDDFNSAMMVKEQSLRSQGRKFTKKENRHCDHYNTNGYTRDICFKLNGYPEWFAELKKKRKGKINT